MNRNRIIALVVVLVLFALAGAFLVAKNVGGGGKKVSYDLTLKGTTMSPTGELEAKQNDTVTISLTGDKAEEVHLHGYDIKFELEPGKKVTHTFKADKTCDCEIEIEDTSTQVGSLTVKP